MSIADKLVSIAENVPKVYEVGEKDGIQAEYDRFWDVFQDYGKRTYYYFAFRENWNEQTFKPKYDLKPVQAYGMFSYLTMEIDLAKWLEDLGVTLDTSNCTNAGYIFQNSKFARFPLLDFRGLTSANNCFQSANKAHTIDKIILKDNGSQTFASTFYGTIALENLTIEGVIGQNGFDVSWSKLLTAESLLSILTALTKDSTLASGKTVTFATASKEVIESDTACAEQLALAVQAGWTVSYMTR